MNEKDLKFLDANINAYNKGSTEKCLQIIKSICEARSTINVLTSNLKKLIPYIGVLLQSRDKEIRKAILNTIEKHQYVLFSNKNITISEDFEFFFILGQIEKILDNRNIWTPNAVTYLGSLIQSIFDNGIGE